MQKILCACALAAWLAPTWALASNVSQTASKAPRTMQRAAPPSTARVPQTRTRYQADVDFAPNYYRPYVRSWHASFGNRPASSKVLGNY
jgi:hypothetical protein